MNERCAFAFANPLARALADAAPYWRRLHIEGRRLSTIVTLNK